jgi:hypothetical protein
MVGQPDEPIIVNLDEELVEEVREALYGTGGQN